MGKTPFSRCFPLIFSLLSLFCAGQVPPSGGPPDTTPPEILAAYPEPGTLHFKGNRIKLSFSKYVERRTLQESIFISPALGEMSFDWGGKEVEMTFGDSLRPNTTYILTIGTDLIDTHNNRLAKAYALPFSTGDHIDSGSIAGRVYDTNPGGVMIFAYELKDRLADTLDPRHTKPDYLTQTGKDGSFLLPYLAMGAYRLLAVRDEYKNLLYDSQVDEYGVADKDVLLTAANQAITGIQFQLTSEDTTPPFLSSARAIDRSHVLLRFSEPVDYRTAVTESCTVADTVSGKSLPVIDFSAVPPSWNEAQLTTAPEESSATYRVQLRGIRDLAGNILRRSQGIADFRPSTTPDTTKPVLTIEKLPDQSYGVAVDDTIRLTINKAVIRSSFEHGLTIVDSLHRAAPCNYVWWNSVALNILPSPPLQYGMLYTIRVKLDSVRDEYQAAARDSMLIRKFTTVEEKDLSSMQGNVGDTVTNERGPYFVTALNTISKDAKPKTVSLPGTGPFRFEGVREGEYSLSAFHDRDSNGVYSYGMPFPYRPAERFTVYPDTLKLRARWPLEGINLRFK